MSIDRRVEGELPRILAELGAGTRPDYAARIVERTATIRQRPAWAVPDHWRPDGPVGSWAATTAIRWRLVVVLVVVVLVILAAIGAAVGSRRQLPITPGGHGMVVYGDAGDIYVGDPVAGDTHPIVSGADYDSHPLYSPDDSKIAFLRRVDPATDGATNIMVAATDGTGVRSITATPLPQAPTIFLWTPDSRSITLLTSTTATSTGVVSFDLVAFDVAATGPPRSINPPGLAVAAPWAFRPPDGRQILFRGQTASGDIGLYVANADGSGAKALVGPFANPTPAESFQDMTFSVWSPDGTRIAYQLMARDESSMGIWVMNADGSNQHEVGRKAGDYYNGWPAWSPDGARLVFQHESGQTSAAGYYTYTYRVLRLSDDSVVDTGPVFDVDSDAVWSPDGAELLVVLKTGQHQLLLDPNGGPVKQVQWAPIGGDWQHLP